MTFKISIKTLKVVLYVSLYDYCFNIYYFLARLISPCANCAPPYSFKNHLNLSDNYNKFKMEVTNAKVSGNLDSPEGGLDAIMQAIVCKEQIGWRPQARHLLIFSTGM